MSRISKRPADALFTIVTDTWTAPFWNAAKEGRLVCAQCAACKRFRMPPTPFCPNCRSQEIDWKTLSGKGTVYSYTIVERAVIPGTEDSIPYAPAVIELEGAPGVRLISNIVDSPIEEIGVGSKVAVTFDTHPSGASIPRFRLATGS